MPEEQERGRLEKCLVYYKSGWLAPEARFYGERFDRLETCCEMFEKMFLNTGNQKNTDWGNSYLFDAKPGINFLKQNRIVNIFFCGEPIKFCPWSGHAIEVKKSRDVKIIEKFKLVSDGYKELNLSEGWDQ